MRERIEDRAIIVLAVALLAMVVLEASLVPHYDPVFPWHRVPGYAAIIGLFGCLIVVQLSKWLGRTLLQRPDKDT